MLRRELLAAHSLIETGKVRPLGSGRTLFIAAQGDETCPLRGVVIADLHRADQPSYVTAACGRIVESQGEGDLALDLSGGAIHVGQWGTDRYDRIRFGSSVVDLRLSELDFFDKRLSQYSFAELMRGPNHDYGAEAIRTEIQRRLAFLFSGLLLGLLAVPLGVRPGRGRSSSLLLSAGGLIGYWCAFTTAQATAQSGLVPAWCLWLPDAGVALLAWVLLRRNPGGEL
jgi:lipopolysaccharide export LptBFGC system permease protein LptF